MDPSLKAKAVARLRNLAPDFTPALKQIAKYILDNPLDFGMDSIRETARKCNTSTYSLVRLSQQVGFESFEAFRAPFRSALLTTVDLQAAPPWLEELRRGDEIDNALADASENTFAIIQRSLERQPPSLIKAVIDQILGSKIVYITAVRASYSMAYYLHYVGRMAVPGLQLIPRHMGSALDELNDATPEDTLIAICFTPYSRETVEACIHAQRNGIKVVLISDFDSISTDFEPDFALVASSVTTHHFGCYVGTLAIIEGLLAGLVAAGGQEVSDRIRSYERLRSETRAYWERKK